MIHFLKYKIRSDEKTREKLNIEKTNIENSSSKWKK